MNAPLTAIIVDVADPTPLRRQLTAQKFGLVDKQCYESAAALAAAPKQADFIINGTMDHQHVPTALPLLERGYHMLLEKPFATSENEMWQLVKMARKYQSKVAICQKIIDGAIGKASMYRPLNTSLTTIWPSVLCAASGAAPTIANRRC
jgi:predicted dehydrogenase